jgi:hypothetical protein
MALSKIQAESMNLADTYAFTGTVSGASDVALISTQTTGSASAIDFTGLDEHLQYVYGNISKHSICF